MSETELSNCSHTQVTNFDNFFYCLQCGAYQSKDGHAALKSKRSRFPAFNDPLKLLESQMARSFAYRLDNAAYLCQRRSLITNMLLWAEKLSLSTGTVFLAVQNLDEFYCHHDEQHYQLYAATSLMLSAKTVELDERIPFISKLKRHTYLPYTLHEIRKAEYQLIKTLGWKLQKTTLIDWVETIQSIGCVFDSDELDRGILSERMNNFQIQKPAQLEKLSPIQPIQTLKQATTFRLTELFDRLEKVTRQVCIQVLLEPALLATDPRMLAMSVIAHIRKTCGFKEALPKQFKELWIEATCLELADLLPPIQTTTQLKRTYSGLQEYSSLQFRPLYQPPPLNFH